jgi:hypothetical protein
MDGEDGGGVMLAVRCAALRSPSLYYDGDDDRSAPRAHHTRIPFASSSSDVWLEPLLC